MDAGLWCAVVGSPGIGKTRLAAKPLQLAKNRGVEVFSTFCESHATDIPFHVVARLLRAIGRLSGLDDRGRAGTGAGPIRGRRSAGPGAA